MAELYIWLIGTIVLALAALKSTSNAFNAGTYFLWLAVIAAWVFGGVAIMAP